MKEKMENVRQTESLSELEQKFMTFKQIKLHYLSLYLSQFSSNLHFHPLS